MYYILTVIILVLAVVCLCLYKSLRNAQADLDNYKRAYFNVFDDSCAYRKNRGVVEDNFEIVKDFISVSIDEFEQFRYFAKHNYVAECLFKTFIKDGISKGYEKLDRRDPYDYPPHSVEIPKDLRIEILHVRRKEG